MSSLSENKNLMMPNYRNTYLSSEQGRVEFIFASQKSSDLKTDEEKTISPNIRSPNEISLRLSGQMLSSNRVSK